MSKIYALQGKADCGKTETIKCVFAMLISKYSVSSAQIREFPDFLVGKEREKEISVIMSGIDGKKIGIMSEGDRRDILEPALAFFVRVGCDILICACRSRGGTEDCIKELDPAAIFESQNNVIGNTRQGRSNNNMARRLIEMAGL